MADRGPGSPPPPPGTLGFRIVKAVTGLNVLVYRATKGRLGDVGGLPLHILHHRGAKSGQPRQTPLSGLPDGEDVVLVASYGGAPKSPAWFHNCMANPDVEIERNGKRRAMTARRATPEERERLWPLVVAGYPGYATYQKRTDREIPLVILSPRSP